MDNIFKGIIGSVICILIVYCGISVLWAVNETSQAQSYLEVIRAEVSASGLDEAALTVCKNDASTKGYTLKTKPIAYSDGSRAYVVLSLEYNYAAPILSLSGTHTKTTVAY